MWQNLSHIKLDNIVSTEEVLDSSAFESSQVKAIFHTIYTE